MQLVVAVPGGVDILVHTAAGGYGEATGVGVRHCRHQERQVNSVSRGVMAQRVIELFPEVWPYFATCYGDVSQLLFGVRDADGIVRRRFVESADGSQQGDPLGCLLLAWFSTQFWRSACEFTLALRLLMPIVTTSTCWAPQTLWRLLSSGCVSASLHLLGR